MAPNDIASKLRRTPFQPLRVFISDGQTFDVTDAAWCGINQTEMFIGVEADDTGIPRRSVYIDTRHVTGIKPLQSPSSSAGNGR